jgi:hypothetical protein
MHTVLTECGEATYQQITTMITIHQCELQQIEAIIPNLLQPDRVAMYSRRQRILQDAVAELQQKLAEIDDGSR